MKEVGEGILRILIILRIRRILKILIVLLLVVVFSFLLVSVVESC